MKTRVFSLLLFAALLALAAPGAARAGSDTPIQDIQLGLILENDPVSVQQVVVTGVAVFGFFIQEPDEDGTFGRKYSGIWVYTNANNGNVKEGDLVNVSGTYIEFFDFSEIDASSGSVSIIGTATIPDPVAVAVSEVNDTGLDSEAYESVLITVDRDDPTLYAFPIEGGGGTPPDWNVHTEPTADADSLVVDHYSGFDYDVPAPGTELTYLSGILVYNFSQYKLAPRDCIRDIGGPCPPTLVGGYATSNNTINLEFAVPMDGALHEDPSNYELASGLNVISAELIDPEVVELTTDTHTPGTPETVTVFESESLEGLTGPDDQESSFRAGITAIRQIQEVADPAVDDVSPFDGEIVTIQGTLSAVEDTYYYLQDDDGGAWDGIYARVAKNGAIAVGDVVQVSGVVREFFGATQVAFSQGTNNFQNLGPGADPVTNLVTAADVIYNDIARTAEPWEFCLVRVENGILDSSGVGDPAFGEWELVQAPDTAGVDLDNFTPYPDEPVQGAGYNVTGILQYDFSVYRIAARDLLDVGQTSTDAPDYEPVALTTILTPNSPNPFRGMTSLQLRLAADAEVSIDIVDVSGRLVRTLARGPMESGLHRLEWDATNAAGRRVASGTYFAKLRTGDVEMAQKMIVN